MMNMLNQIGESQGVAVHNDRTIINEYEHYEEEINEEYEVADDEEIQYVAEEIQYVAEEVADNGEEVANPVVEAKETKEVKEVDGREVKVAEVKEVKAEVKVVAKKDRESKFQVYRLDCSHCSLKYIGSTKNGIRQRLGNHKSCARTGKPGLLRDHMRMVGADKFRTVEIYSGVGTRATQQAMEHKYILQYDSVKNGFNMRVENCRCEHGKMRAMCVECGGSGICQHGIQRHVCADCGGASVCEHRRQRHKCVDCNDYRCAICDRKYSSKQALAKHMLTKKHLLLAMAHAQEDED